MIFDLRFLSSRCAGCAISCLRVLLCGCIAFGTLLAVAPSADALIVMNIDPSANNTAPDDDFLEQYTGVDPGEAVDPGWANITTRGIYLGNGWVLTADHTTLSTSASETIGSNSYDIISGSKITIKNPTVLTDAGRSTLSDVEIFRVDSLAQFDGTVEQREASLRPIKLGSSSLSAGSEVLIMGTGPTKWSPIFHWETSNSGLNWSDRQVCDGCMQGDLTQLAPTGQSHAIGFRDIPNGSEKKNWGTNTVADPSSVIPSYYTNDFYQQVGSTPYYTIQRSSSGSDTAVQAFNFDQYDFEIDQDGNITGGGGNEAQGIGGDSGSGVFHWNGSEWVLNGVLHSITRFMTDPLSNAHVVTISRDRPGKDDFRYGDVTYFTDISAYSAEIEKYLAPPEGFEWTGQGEDTRFFHLVGREFGYVEQVLQEGTPQEETVFVLSLINPGLWGDVNLDGQVSGDGTGTWATDDVAALIEGWGFSHASADIFSWKRGDLNQDGLTNLDDFLLLRSGLNPQVAAQLNLNQLLSSAGLSIPEPSSALLASLVGLGLLAWRLGRR